jgi:glycosyltransferase involved in cell wall biosynthesis
MNDQASGKTTSTGETIDTANGPSILFLHHGTLYGGAPLSLLYTAIGIKNRGYAVSIGLVKPDVDLREFYEGYGFTTYLLPFIQCYYYSSAAPQYWTKGHTYRNLARAAWNWRRSQRLFKKFLQQGSFDLVHLNSVGLVNPAIAMLASGQRFVWHVREYGPSNSDWRHTYFKKYLRRARHVFFLSHAEQISWLGNEEVGTVVHNFVDVDKFSVASVSTGVRGKYGFPAEVPLLLFLGGFKKHKGIDIVLDAAGELRKEGIDFRLLMPGTLGATRNIYEDKIGRMGLQDYCVLDTFITDIRPYFRDATVLLFPATVPHFARPVVEAAAMKVPSIATRLPPMDELIIDGQTGELYELGDLQDLMTKIRSLLASPERRKEMGRASRVFAEGNFSAERQLDKIITVYEEALTKLPSESFSKKNSIAPQ